MASASCGPPKSKIRLAMPSYEKRPRSRSYRKTVMSNVPLLTIGLLVMIAFLAALFFIVTGGST